MNTEFPKDRNSTSPSHLMAGVVALEQHEARAPSPSCRTAHRSSLVLLGMFILLRSPGNVAHAQDVEVGDVDPAADVGSDPEQAQGPISDESAGEDDGTASASGIALTPVLEVRFTARIDGRLAEARCEGGTNFAASSEGRALTTLSSPPTTSAPVLKLDTGGLLGPSGVARFAESHDAEGMMSLFGDLGIDALVFGVAELGIWRTDLKDALLTLHAANLPIVASNLHCDGPAEHLCQHVQDAADGPVFIDREGLRIAVMSAIPSSALHAVANQHAEGVTLQAPQEAIATAVRRAHQGQADLTIAVLDASTSADAAGEALRLAEALPDDARPDLIIAARAGRQLIFARPPFVAPAIVAAQPGTATRALLRAPIKSVSALTVTDSAQGSSRHRLDILATPIPAPSEDAPLHEAYSRWLTRTGASFCSMWGQPLPGGSLARPFAADDLVQLLAHTTRAVSNAEVAVLNRALVDAAFRPMKAGQLSHGDVMLGVQYDEPIVTANVTEKWLKGLFDRLATYDLIAPGLTKEGDTYKLHGRPLVGGGTYRVATIQFLASGGDDAFPSETVDWSVGRTTVRDAMLATLEAPSSKDPRERTMDGAESWEWVTRTSGDITFSDTSISAPTDDTGAPIYESSQLTRANNTSIGAFGLVQVNAQNPWLGVENEVSARYRDTKTDDGPFTESDDLITLRSTTVYRGWVRESNAFYMPQPYLALYGESEFTVPDTRDYRRVLLRPTGGLRFALLSHVNLQLSGGAEWEGLNPDATVRPGAGALLTLTPYKLLEAGSRSVEVEGSVDYFWTASHRTLRMSADLRVALGGPFSLVFGSRIYGEDRPSVPAAYATDFTAALRIAWLGRTTQF